MEGHLAEDICGGRQLEPKDEIADNVTRKSQARQLGDLSLIGISRRTVIKVARGAVSSITGSHLMSVEELSYRTQHPCVITSIA